MWEVIDSWSSIVSLWVQITYAVKIFKTSWIFRFYWFYFKPGYHCAFLFKTCHVLWHKPATAHFIMHITLDTIFRTETCCTSTEWWFRKYCILMVSILINQCCKMLWHKIQKNKCNIVITSPGTSVETLDSVACNTMTSPMHKV